MREISIPQLRQIVEENIITLGRSAQKKYPKESLYTDFDQKGEFASQDVKTATLAYCGEVVDRGAASSETTDTWFQTLFAAGYLRFLGDDGGETKA
jgi:hypothetical protein